MWRSDYIVGFLSLNHSFQQNIWLQSDIIFTCTWLITGIQGTHRNQVGRKLTSSTPTPFKCLTWCKQNWGPVRALRFISTGPSKNCLLITDRDSRYFKHAIIFLILLKNKHLDKFISEPVSLTSFLLSRCTLSKHASMQFKSHVNEVNNFLTGGY